MVWWQVDDSDFFQLVKEVSHDLEDDSDEHLNFVLDSEHISESKQSAGVNKNDLKLAAAEIIDFPA